MSDITHNTTIATGGIGAMRHRVQAYAIRVNSSEAEIRLDLNVAEPVSLIDLSPADARRVIAILRASLADLKEDS